MAAAAQILKNFNLYVDGRGYAGNADEIQLPALKITEEEYRAGGMDAPLALDMGMEKLEAQFKVSKYDSDLIKLFGGTANISVTARGALEDFDGVVKPVVVNLTGRIHGLEAEAWTPGGKSAMTFTMACSVYVYTLDGVQLHDIDVPNMKRIIGGVDRLAAIRAAIGM